MDWKLQTEMTVPNQFVIFKSLTYCFKETIAFDVNASFASGP